MEAWVCIDWGYYGTMTELNDEADEAIRTSDDVSDTNMTITAGGSG